MISMFSAMTTMRLNGFGGYLSALSSSQCSLIILVYMVVLAACGYVVFRDWFFRNTLILFIVMTFPFVLDVFFFKSNRETIEILIDVIVFQNILCAVPYTVYRFRSTFVKLLMENTEVL